MFPDSCYNCETVLDFDSCSIVLPIHTSSYLDLLGALRKHILKVTSVFGTIRFRLHIFAEGSHLMHGNPLC